MTTNVWRLFYQDNNYTYLITDECVGSYKPSDYYTDIYNSGVDVSTVWQKLNPMLLEVGTFFTTSNTNRNILATAWLTDMTVWEEFENNDAVFVIGNPTLKLYVKLFNATVSQIKLGVGNYRYTQNITPNRIKTNIIMEYITKVHHQIGYYLLLMIIMIIMKFMCLAVLIFSKWLRK